jgi:hypothetical protein
LSRQGFLYTLPSAAPAGLGGLPAQAFLHALTLSMKQTFWQVARSRALQANVIFCLAHLARQTLP